MQLFILIHVAISLVAIVTGLVVLVAMLGAKYLRRTTAIFLATTAATSLTGFCFLPFDGFTPAQGFGIISVVVLTPAFYGLYARRLAGGWRATYVITATFALYLNCFVLVVQSFQKIPPLKQTAPTQSAPAFIVAQVTVMILFIIAGIFAVKKFRGSSLPIRIG